LIAQTARLNRDIVSPFHGHDPVLLARELGLTALEINPRQRLGNLDLGEDEFAQAELC
jgi:hypothetical protein